MKKQYEQIILDSINELLKREGITQLTLEQTEFCLDDDVNYDTYTINHYNIFNKENFIEILTALFDGGPDWIHGNLMSYESKGYIITLKAGKKVGNPNPTINVSLELNRKLKMK